MDIVEVASGPGMTFCELAVVVESLARLLHSFALREAAMAAIVGDIYERQDTVIKKEKIAASETGQ
jgi:hypothetical protein